MAFIDYQNDIENNIELQAAAMAVQNDLYRKALIDPIAAIEAQKKNITGQVVFTNGVFSEGPEFIQAAMVAVSAFDQFTEENDTYGEHDFGAFTVQNTKLYWKIDYYNLDMTQGSERPYVPAETMRVLTIMTTSEY